MADVTADASRFNRAAYKSFLHTLSSHLTTKNVQEIIFITDLPGGESQQIASPLELFRSLELHGHLDATVNGLTFLKKILQDIHRWDLSKRVETFLTEQRIPQKGVDISTPTISFPSGSHKAKELSSTRKNVVLMKPNDYVGKKGSPSMSDDLTLRESSIDESIVSLPSKQIYHKQAISNDEHYQTPVGKGDSAVSNEDYLSQTTKQDENGASILSPMDQEDFQVNLGSQTCYSAPPTRPITHEDGYDHDDFYKMRNEPRGICVILNNEQFEQNVDDKNQLEDRDGSSVDVKNLEKIFKLLKFDVRSVANLSAEATRKYFQEIANEDHSDYDCFVACILSHGCSEGFYGVDHKVVVIEEILHGFKQCKSLRKKPKLFFAQFCRGELIDEVVRDSEKPLIVHRENPSEADIYIAYATPPGYVSWRSKSNGTWFISKLCEWLEYNAGKEDLDGIMKKVKRDVAESFTSDYHKQVPYVCETLTKKVKFL